MGLVTAMKIIDLMSMLQAVKVIAYGGAYAIIERIAHYGVAYGYLIQIGQLLMEVS